MTTPNQGKIQSTFLQSVRNNKFFVTLVAVVLATGIMAYNTNPVSSSNQFRVGNYAVIVDGSKGGGIIGSENGVVTGGGSVFYFFLNCIVIAASSGPLVPFKQIINYVIIMLL